MEPETLTQEIKEYALSHGAELARLIEEDLPFTDFRNTPDNVFRSHMPRFTKNSVLMCTFCQKACPYGREKRGL